MRFLHANQCPLRLKTPQERRGEGPRQPLCDASCHFLTAGTTPGNSSHAEREDLYRVVFTAGSPAMVQTCCRHAIFPRGTQISTQPIARLAGWFALRSTREIEMTSQNQDKPGQRSRVSRIRTRARSPASSRAATSRAARSPASSSRTPAASFERRVRGKVPLQRRGFSFWRVVLREVVLLLSRLGGPPSPLR